MQVYPDSSRRREFMKQLGITDLFYPDERIRALGEREGFDVLTLAPTFQAYAEQHHVDLHGYENSGLGQGHWNVEGHHLAGKLIAEKLCENGKF